MVPPTRYGWDDDHVSFALVIETEPDSYREAIKENDHNKWITAKNIPVEKFRASLNFIKVL